MGTAVACLKAPVPYLNRALAEEQLGVDEDQQNQHQAAQGQYSGAVKVCLFTCHVSFKRGWSKGGGGAEVGVRETLNPQS